MTEKEAKQRKVAYAMLLDGFSLKEVARGSQMTEEEIKKLFTPIFPELKKKRQKTEGVYIGLEKWLEETKMTNKQLGKLLGRSDAYVIEARKNSRGVQFKISEVEMLLDITGMTFEECFAKEKAPEDAATSIKG
jgi:hypothetical protein